MRRLTVFVVAMILAVQTATAEMITLKDGTVLMGEVLEGDEKGLRMRRYDTGGVVFLPWSFLIERDAKRIKKDRGLDIGELDFLQIPGVRLELTDRSVYEGVIAARDAKQVWIHTAHKKLPIPLHRIVREVPVTVSAVEVYPPEKLYDDQIAKGAPENADDHFQLAKFCLQIEHYEKAIAHFSKVQELDAQFKPDFVQARLNECESLLANQATAQLFNRIKRLTYANKYKEALQQIETMEGMELDEVWKSKLQKRKAEVEDKREKFLVRSMASVMPPLIRAIATKAGKDRNMSWQDARRYAQRDFSRDLQARLMKRFDIEDREVRELVSKIRSFTQVKVSYGAFTWFAPGERPPNFKRRQANNRNNNRGRRGGRNGRNNQQQEKPKPLPKQDELWGDSVAKQRTNYIHAMWAERGREVHVVRKDRRPCGTCGGRGTVRTTGEGGIVDTRCPRCRGIGTDSVIVYRLGPGDGSGNVKRDPEKPQSQGLSPAERLRQRILERRRQREERRRSGGGDDNDNRGGRGGRLGRGGRR